MKTKRFSFLASLFLAAALTLSCSDGNSWWDEFKKELGNGIKESLNLKFDRITGSNLLQNGKLGFTSNSDGFPDEGDDVIESVQINGATLPGGPTFFTVTSSAKLKVIYLQIEGERGFYQIDLEDPLVLADEELGLTENIEAGKYVYRFVIIFNQSLGDGEGDGERRERKFIVSGKTTSGQNVEPEEKKLKTINVLSGKLQIALSWDNSDDVDLYVWTPNGDRIYYSNKGVRNGKDSLDIDSNASCGGAGDNAENVAIGVDGGDIPTGQYKIAVHLFLKCSDTPRSGASFRVTAAYDGSFIREFGGKSVKFGDTERGSGVSGMPDTYPASDNSTVKKIGIINIKENGSYEVL
ncbi:MAG: hypothetical protein LBC64_09940 [Fibromonadaceae bacterium]|jgi:hypothetical protein|nr:hypothetical protein [Fibromonadaceae bacterium]